MNKTKIEWCDMTWNPVTGCLHGCGYCYARKIAERFGGGGYGIEMGMFISKYKEGVFQPPYDLAEPQFAKTKNDWYREAPYPYGFEPTFHRYRLDEPQKVKKPQNVFVCSMADLFGDWVPDEWVKQVFEACKKAPQHRYLFLTKNPERYCNVLKRIDAADNFWFGTTITNDEMPFFWSDKHNTFLSIESLQSDFKEKEILNSYVREVFVDWVIIGAETGNRKGKVTPKREWIENIVNYCREMNVPVFMKDSLAKVWGGPLIREYPWGDQNA